MLYQLSYPGLRDVITSYACGKFNRFLLLQCKSLKLFWVLMAVMYIEGGSTLVEFDAINAHLKPLNVWLERWPLSGAALDADALLKKHHLDETGKQQLLSAFDGYFEKLKVESGYQSRDLVVINPDLPGLEGLLDKFNRCHTHDDDEVRYIVDGEGIFGFVLPDGAQVELLVGAEDFINIPADTEHWFYLTDLKRIKAIRYFTTTSGWMPVYTETRRRNIRL